MQTKENKKAKASGECWKFCSGVSLISASHKCATKEYWKVAHWLANQTLNTPRVSKLPTFPLLGFSRNNRQAQTDTHSLSRVRMCFRLFEPGGYSVSPRFVLFSFVYPSEARTKENNENETRRDRIMDTIPLTPFHFSHTRLAHWESRRKNKKPSVNGIVSIIRSLLVSFSLFSF